MAGVQQEALDLLVETERRYVQVQDYTAVFEKVERVDGILQPKEVVQMKFQRPFRVYMKWLAGRPKGRELVFVAGANRNKLVVHEGRGFGRFITALVDPESSLAMRGNRHPVTDLGLGRMIEILLANVMRARGRGEVELLDRGPAAEDGRLLRRVEGIFPRDRPRGYYCYRFVLAVDTATMLPARVTVYDWDDVLVEEYAYSDLRVNPGLVREDFETTNPAYNFPAWQMSF